MTEPNAEEKKFNDTQGIDDENADIDLDDSKAKFINHSAKNGGKGTDGAVVVQVVEPSESVDSFVGLGKDELAKYADDPFYVRLRWALFILFWIAWVAMLVAAIVIIVLAPKCPHRPDLKWYHKNTVYKVYTKSFKDADGNGVGDIKGISDKLGYIKDLGVKTLWLSGLYASDAQDDQAILNHTMVNPSLGTMEELQAFIKKASKEEIKIMLDLIPNHTSKNHTWFMASVKRDGKYADYYVWAGNDPSQAPSDLMNMEGGPAWKWDDTRKQFYLAQFGLPELNLSNPDVIKEFEAIVGRWLSIGVGGFYVANVDYLVDNITTSDVTVAVPDPATQPGYVTASNGGADSRSFLQQLRTYIAGTFDKPGRERFLMAAVDVLNATVMESYFGNEEGRMLDLVANRAFMKKLTKQCKATCLKQIIDEVPDATEKEWPVWMVGNDDIARIFDRIGHDNAIAVITIQMTLPGTPVVYYGDEIGMTTGTNAVVGNIKKEDNYRTPMQWTNKPGAGFSTANKTWIPVNADYTTINVQTENAHRSGHGQLETIMSLAALRTNESLQFGTKETYVYKDLLWMIRRATGFPAYLIIINFGNQDTSYMFHGGEGGVDTENLQLVFHSMGADAVGSVYNIKERALAIKALEAAVYKFV